jgi:general secretion pathway protein E
MHTNSSSGAITRLLEMEIEPFLISTALNGVIAQRLVKKLCLACRKEYPANKEIVDGLNKIINVKGPVVLAKPVGCERCFGTGYEGREGVFEILDINEEIRTKILKSASEHEIVDAALLKGMQTLKTAGLKKAIQRTATLEEIIQITSLD